jgi:hypothetical protein
VEVLTFGDPNGAALLAVFIAFLGVLIAAVIYMVVTRLRPGWLGGVVAGVFALGVSALAYWLFLTPFYAVEIEGQQVRLRRFYPSRALTLEKGQIERFERRNEVTKNNYVVSLVVFTKDGRRFESGQSRPQELAANIARLEAWLKQ